MVSIPFDFLNNLPTITNNADGSVTVNGVTYKDGQIVEDTPIIEDTPIVDETTQGLLDTIAGNNDYLAGQGYTYDSRTGSWTAPPPPPPIPIEPPPPHEHRPPPPNDDDPPPPPPPPPSDIDAINIFKDNANLSWQDLKKIPGLEDNLVIGLKDNTVTQDADGNFIVTTRDGSQILYGADGSDPILLSDTDYSKSSLGSSLVGDTSAENFGSVTMDDIYAYLKEGGLESGAKYLQEGSMSPEEVAARYLSGDRLTGFQDLMRLFDRDNYTYEGDTLTYNPNNPDFGAGTGMNQVYFLNPRTGEPAFMSASEAAALGVQPGAMYSTPQAFMAAYPEYNPDNTQPEPTPTDTINYQDLYTNS